VKVNGLISREIYANVILLKRIFLYLSQAPLGAFRVILSSPICDKLSFVSEFYLFHEYLAALGIAQVNLALLSLARYLNTLNIGCARHNSSKLDSALAGTIFSRETRERPFCCFIFITSFFYMYKQHGLTQISQIHADKRQVGQINLLKQMPQRTLTKTVTALWEFMWFVFCLRESA